MRGVAREAVVGTTPGEAAHQLLLQGDHRTQAWEYVLVMVRWDGAAADMLQVPVVLVVREGPYEDNTHHPDHQALPIPSVAAVAFQALQMVRLRMAAEVLLAEDGGEEAGEGDEDAEEP